MQSDVNFPLVLCKPSSQIIQPKFNQCKRFVLHPLFPFIYLTISILGSSIIFGLSLKYTLRFVPSKVVNLYLTDPPYNVGYGYEGSAMMSKRKHRTDGLTVKNDKMDNDKFRDFLSAAFLAAEETMEKGAAFYIFHSDNYSMWFREALMSTKDLELRETLIWNKDSLCLGRQDYQWKHEPCLYGWKNGGAHNWFNDRAQTTVIDMARPKVSREHPTMKPVPLFAYLMGNSTKEGWNVYDGFGGSGTTLIAAEQLNRNAFLMELDPHYCDVIIARWEKLTGEKAVKIDEFKKQVE